MHPIHLSIAMKSSARHTTETLAVRGWVKDGRKAYSHISGVTLKYDCNKWCWTASTGRTFKSLKSAIYHLSITR